jgi:hypothetical protein
VGITEVRMNVTCPGCGAFNRAGAKFCAVCGRRLPTAPASPPLPTALAPRQLAPLQPQPPQLQPQALPPQVAPPPPPPVVQMPRSGLFQTAPVVAGKVSVVDQERQEKAPFDPARAMVMLAFIAVLLGLFIGFAAAGLTLGILLLILGVGVGLLGCLFSILLMPLQLILGPIINAIRGERTVMVLNFQVLDNRTAAPVDVLLYRKPGGANVRIGDVVQVHGSIQRGNNVVRAGRIHVIESAGRPTNYKIDALKPWPIWIGLLILGLAVAGALQLAGVIHIR